MKYLKYIVLSVFISALFACQKYETPIFTDKPSFEFTDTLFSAPMGFIADGSYTVNLVIRLFGNLPTSDMKVKIDFSGTAKVDRDFEMPSEFIFPKGQSEIKVSCKILSSPELTLLGDRDLIMTIIPSDDNVAGVRPKSHVKIEVGMPSDWIGNNAAWYFPFSVLGKCTVAKYQFFYKTFGFYDFTTLPEYTTNPWDYKLYNLLNVYKPYLNSMIAVENAERAANGDGPLLDDDKSELKF